MPQKAFKSVGTKGIYHLNKKLLAKLSLSKLIFNLIIDESLKLKYYVENIKLHSKYLTNINVCMLLHFIKTNLMPFHTIFGMNTPGFKYNIFSPS